MSEKNQVEKRDTPQLSPTKNDGTTQNVPSKPDGFLVHGKSSNVDINPQPTPLNVVDDSSGNHLGQNQQDPASQGKAERKTAVDLTKVRMEKLMDAAYKEGLSDMLFCPETMGKLGQIGTVEEITEFCKIDKALCPCVDFGHVNAREQGSLKTEKDYEERLAFMIAELGYGKMKDFHVHFSKIEYSSGGEVRHLTFEDDKFGPEFAPLSVTLKKLGLEPYVICESAGTQDKDAAAMRKIYYNN